MVTNNNHYWQKYGFFGGHLFIDFLNTYDDVGKTRLLDAIPDWSTLLSWALALELISKTEVKLLYQCREKVIKAELKKLQDLRDCGWGLFRNLASKKSPESNQLSELMDAVKLAYSGASLSPIKKGFTYSIDYQDAKHTLIRVRLGLAAGELITSPLLSKLAECNRCSGLFLNTGRGVGRKWCRMNTCGNRAKISKFRSAS